MKACNLRQKVMRMSKQKILKKNKKVIQDGIKKGLRRDKDS